MNVGLSNAITVWAVLRGQVAEKVKHAAEVNKERVVGRAAIDAFARVCCFNGVGNQLLVSRVQTDRAIDAAWRNVRRGHFAAGKDGRPSLAAVRAALASIGRAQVAGTQSDVEVVGSSFTRMKVKRYVISSPTMAALLSMWIS